MEFLYLKAFHIIFVVTWFSGMFYLVRLFIYNREAQDKEENERAILTTQFNIMIKRLLFAITWPSAILTLILGTWLVLHFDAIPTWLYIKLGLVLLLFVYQFTLHTLYKQQAKGIFNYTSTQLRIWNEVPTIILIAVVMLVVVRQNLSAVYGVLGIFALAVSLMVAVKVYKRLREKGNPQ
jgi:putative membrane protein